MDIVVREERVLRPWGDTDRSTRPLFVLFKHFRSLRRIRSRVEWMMTSGDMEGIGTVISTAVANLLVAMTERRLKS